MDARAREIFRRIVEGYLETGEPVGSRTLSRGGLSLSPASIRNTMQDLTQLGLLGAPHSSAGRLPTHAGLRLFVDGLLEVGDIGGDERREIETRLLAHGRNYEDALNEASAILSGLAGGAAVVVTPVRDAGVSHVEFVPLSGDRTLAIMVFDDGVVENRLIRQPAGVTPSALQEASNFLNARMRGRTLGETKADLRGELDRATAAAPADSNDPAVKNYVIGVEMTSKELLAAFDRNGLKRIDPPQGEKFDPHKHQAMMEQPGTDVVPGGVVQVMQAGYELLGRLVRPAMVVVAAKVAGAAPAANPYAGGEGDVGDAGASLDTRA